ncbi:hypothetical protein L6452_21050 [Arctium lappa]|uniref:Uncharacterized protein n=1 Tax=Arctium lappa TaxID=4217 RepID=A0ACB9BCM9_ARCLA|nr:hypothetical protein L6452_21050 [Arctium lappa]
MMSTNQWSSGLCDCCSEVSTCCFVYWCPCIDFGEIAEILDEGTTYANTCCLKNPAMIALSVSVASNAPFAKSIVSLSIMDLICLLICILSIDAYVNHALNSKMVPYISARGLILKLDEGFN